MNNKPFDIPKSLVVEAWERVRRARGGAGIDGISLKHYEENLKQNLYLLWNRMSSGSYFPLPVKEVGIPKASGIRYLKIPTVRDRIAQTVVLLYLSPHLESVFCEESYGSRKGKSAHEALSHCRSHCFEHAWVIDLDIKSFFDHVNHELLTRAVEKHTTSGWVRLYLKRWLECPTIKEDGTTTERGDVGIPQGAPISPLLANLYLHYGVDLWMKREYPTLPFERYLDDIIIHCKSEQESNDVLRALTERLKKIGLKANERKTQIVYCYHDRRPPIGGTTRVSFTFLGFDFKPRPYKDKKGNLRLVFTPAVGNAGKKEILFKIEKAKVFRYTQLRMQDIATVLNPKIRGWMSYFGAFRPSEMAKTLHIINKKLTKWAKKKYKTSLTTARKFINRVVKDNSTLFDHWTMVRP